MSPATGNSRQLRIAGLALVLSAVLLAGSAFGASTGTLLNASNTTGATTAVDAGGSSYVAVHVWRSDSASASTSVVYLQVSLDKTNWYRAATFTNVTGMHGTTGDGGDSVSVPSWPFMRLYVSSCTTGRLTAKYVAR